MALVKGLVRRHIVFGSIYQTKTPGDSKSASKPKVSEEMEVKTLIAMLNEQPLKADAIRAKYVRFNSANLSTCAYVASLALGKKVHNSKHTVPFWEELET